MPADCKPYYYIGNSGNVKENFIFFVPGKIVYSMQKKSDDFFLHIF